MLILHYLYTRTTAENCSATAFSFLCDAFAAVSYKQTMKAEINSPDLCRRVCISCGLTVVHRHKLEHPECGESFVIYITLVPFLS